MVRPTSQERISKIDTYLNCAENYIVVPATELVWVQQIENIN